MSKSALAIRLLLVAVVLLLGCSSNLQPVNMELSLPGGFRENRDNTGLSFAMIPPEEGGFYRMNAWNKPTGGMGPMVNLLRKKVPKAATNSRVFPEIKEAIENRAGQMRGVSMTFKGKEQVTLNKGMKGILASWEFSGGDTRVYKHVLLVCGRGQCLVADSAAANSSVSSGIENAFRDARVKAIDQG